MDDDEIENQLLLQTEKTKAYTGDGSVNFRGQPALKIGSGAWRAFPFLFVNRFCERLAFNGIEANLVNYLTHKMHQGNVAAARNVSTWLGTCYLTPLVGAFLADAYWGKYWTVVVFSTIYLIGISALTLSASIPAFQPAECSGSICPSATPVQHAILFVGLYLVSLGVGGVLPCAQAFGADQFDDTDPTERRGKGSFFHWYYFATSLGILVSSTLVVGIQENVGWGLGFRIPTSFIGVSVAVFFCGTLVYRFQRPGGSSVIRVCQTVVASLRKYKLDVPQDSSLLYEISDQVSAIVGSRKLRHTEELKFLDKAAVLSDNEPDSSELSNRWRLCTVTQVEELKILIRMFPIWVTSIAFSAVFAQMSTTFVEQGTYMDRSFRSLSIPAASLSFFAVIAVMLCIPIYDKLIIRMGRKFTARERGLSNLQRMGIGLFISLLTLLVAALVEIKRLQQAKMDTMGMSIFWQVPQYVLMGVAETFFYIGKSEFFYEESPDAMRSVCSAFALLAISGGKYLNSLALTIVSAATTAGGKSGWIPDDLNKGQLYNYFLLWAGLGALNLLVFVCCAMKYKHKTTS